MKVCLCSIVKNEAKNIEATLRSILPFIDSWCICDTGSTDGTQKIIKRVMKGKPGKLHETNWKSFGENRTENFRLAEKVIPKPAKGGKSDWFMFLLDGSDFFAAAPGFRWPDAAPECDGYSMLVRYGGGTTGDRCHLVRAHRGWRYNGPVHEFAEIPGAPGGPGTHGALQGCEYISTDPPAGRPAQCFLRDAKLLEAHLEKIGPDDPWTPRWQFYHAQSYWCVSDYPRAKMLYELRAQNANGWDEERWYSAYRVMLCSIRMKAPWPVVMTEAIRAYEMRPTRAEPYFHLARYIRDDANSGARSLAFALVAAALPPPRDSMFIETDVYKWESLEGASIAAGWAGLDHMASTFGRRALDVSPPSEHERIHKNMAAWAARMKSP